MDTKEIVKAGGASLFLVYPSIVKALRTVYPHFDWDSSKFRPSINSDASDEKWQPSDYQRNFLAVIKDSIGVKEVCFHLIVLFSNLSFNDQGFRLVQSKQVANHKIRRIEAV